MKCLYSLIIIAILPTIGWSSHKKDPLKGIRIEVETFGTQGNQRIYQNLKKMYKQDQSDLERIELTSHKGSKRAFDPKKAQENREIEHFLTDSTPKEAFEGSETIFNSGKKYIETPAIGLGSYQETETFIEEEIALHTCQEQGLYQFYIDQIRHVSVAPEVRKQVKKCQGHKEVTPVSWGKSALTKRHNIEKKLKKDPTIHSYTVRQESAKLLLSVLVASYYHVDDTFCKNFITKEVVTQPRKETDRWISERLSQEGDIESDPNCEIIHTIPLDQPSVKTIDRESIYRDSWKRRLVVSCGKDENSQCRRLREQNGILVEKKCLRTSQSGECALWEKCYDLGRKAPSHRQNLTFSDQEIWGLQDQLTRSHEKNGEFERAISTLSIIASSGQDTQIDAQSASIFQGESAKCQRNCAKELYDCCRSLDGIAVNLHLAQCTQEEKTLAQDRHQGKCHYVGSKKSGLNLNTNQVYCCFSSQIARVFQEQGRQQLGIEWGSAESPSCRGLTLEEIQSIDFDQLDLTEIIETFPEKISRAELKKKFQDVLSHHQPRPSHIEQNTQNAIREEMTHVH